MLARFAEEKEKKGITVLVMPRQVIFFKILKIIRLPSAVVTVKTGLRRLGERVATCCAQHSLALCARISVYIY